MLKKIGMALLASLLLAGGQAWAGADDVKWVNQCVKDNRDEGAKPEVVRKYCECMNNKMDDNETKSISQWEKSHPKEMKDCERQSGWK